MKRDPDDLLDGCDLSRNDRRLRDEDIPWFVLFADILDDEDAMLRRVVDWRTGFLSRRGML